VTHPGPSDRPAGEAAAIPLRVEDDPPPVVRALAADLAARLADPGFAARSSPLRGSVGLRDTETPQAATIRLDDEGIEVAHGCAVDAELRATVDLRRGTDAALEGADEHRQLARWLSDLLAAPLPAWPDAAARFWSILAAMPGAPEALLVVELESGEERRFGNPEGPAYELHGGADNLAEVLSGRVALVDAAFAGAVFVRGTFPELSVLSGAGFRLRYGIGDQEAADG
jgi:hypothetical protein